jgi:hypothetical protein
MSRQYRTTSRHVAALFMSVPANRCFNAGDPASGPKRSGTRTPARTCGTPACSCGVSTLSSPSWPELHAGLRRIAAAWDTPQREEVLQAVWPGQPNIAENYAVI